ncbi:polysaccharide biosynthesis tyrosine autokinase [Oricola sp.]|uniref:GumC family protein n=1 Tax=Oricola sp. TaxID=1979950 RepID=UPI0025D3AC19|nr:polysaccharide biosynthesis tyrosine autokinase [Oricola sp.]MCI5073617.1 polysaccharide biosynthesis tyrosine autokinase [Oricola sp.]
MNKFEPDRRAYDLPAPTQRGVAYYQEPPVGYGHFAEEEEDSLDPLKLIWFVVQYRWLIAAFALAGLAIGVFATYLQTPLYQATTKVEVITPSAKVIQDLELVAQASDLRAFETAREKMLSRDLARRVVFALNLTEDEKFLAPTPSFSLTNLFNRILDRSPSADLEDLSAETREAMAVARVRGGLSVSLLRNTSILSVTYSHADPKYAAEVSRQVVRSFIDQNVDKTSETSDLARQFIEQQVRETKEKLQESERALVAYAKDAGITLTGNDASLISENISKLNAALAEALQDRLKSEAYVDQVKEGNAATLPEVFESDSIQSTKQKIAELRASYQEKLTTLKPGFPEMQRIQSQITELQNQIDAEIGAIARAAEIRLAQAEERVSGLRNEITKLEAEQSEFQDKNIQYTILRREVESNRSQYDSLISKLNEVGVGSDLKTNNASIIDLATVPGIPYSPSLKRNVALTLALFLALAAGLVYLLELMRNTFTVPDQVENELKIPVLGILPRKTEDEIQVEMKDPKSGLSEAYRSLRTSLQFTGVGDSMHTLLVTSPDQSEGKSTTAFRLAHDFSALGKKVLVVDADMRNPRMHRLFQTENSAGLSNVLSNVLRKGDVSSILHKTADPRITLLPAGTIPPNPVELLMSQKMAAALGHMSKAYDIVIVDSPPVLGLADAPVLSRLADATLLVVSSKQVTRKAAKHALDRLRNASGNVVGAALTKFAIDKFDYSYAYRYTYYNYYNYDNASVEIEDHATRGAKGDIAGKLARGGSGLVGRFKRRFD